MKAEAKDSDLRLEVPVSFQNRFGVFRRTKTGFVQNQLVFAPFKENGILDQMIELA